MTECIRSCLSKHLGVLRPVANPGQGNRGPAEMEQGFEQTLDLTHANKNSKGKDQAVEQVPSHEGHVGNSIEMEQVNGQVLSVSESDNMDSSKMELESEQTSNHRQVDLDSNSKNQAVEQAIPHHGHFDGSSIDTEQAVEPVLSELENNDADLTEMEEESEQTSADPETIEKNQAVAQAIPDQGHDDGNSTKTQQVAEQALSYPENGDMDFTYTNQASEQTSNHEQANLHSISYNEEVEQTLSDQEHTTYPEQEAVQISHQGQATTNSVQALEEKRTILIIGTSRCGKSTIANKMLGNDEFKINSNISSNTSQTEPFCMHEGTRKISGKKYNISVIDAIGFDSELFNRENMEMFLENKKICNINLIAFVIKAGKISVSERTDLQSSITYFATSSLQQTSALIFTRCELYDDQKRESIIEEFKKDDYLGKIAQLMQTRIITTGIPSDNKVLLNRLEDSIKKDTAQIDKLITEAGEAVDVNSIFQPAEEKPESNNNRCHVM